MNIHERIRNIWEGKPTDRLPQLEWGPWWDLTLTRWRQEGMSPDTPVLHWAAPGMPVTMERPDIGEELGLDPFRVVWIGVEKDGCPQPAASGAGVIRNRDEYRQFKRHLYPEHGFEMEYFERLRDSGMALWMWLEGFFWVPRKLLGIEAHLFAFYDQPELLEEINQDVVDYYLRVLPELFSVMSPDVLVIGEDLSYNHGPMLSKESFDRICAPYYRQLLPYLKSVGIHPLMDSDGDVTTVIPWLLEVGIEGLGPLERMAGVDVNALRNDYPELLLLGGFDKTVISRGEAAMRIEFERLLPTIRSGRYLPTVDHQTPPEASLEQYRIYRRLFREYTASI